MIKVRKGPYWQLVFIFFLVGCGGGSSSSGDGTGSPVTHASPGGFYTGTVTSNVTGQTMNVAGLVSEDGEARFVSDEGYQYVISLSVHGNELSGSLRGYAPQGMVFVNGQSLTTGTITGSVSERSSLTGGFSAAGGDTGSFSLSYDGTAYERASSIGLLEGLWGYQLSNGYSLSVSIGSNGEVFGQDSDGCVYSGEVRTIDTQFNLYRLNLGVTLCGGFNGSYEGLAIRHPQTSNNPEVVSFAMSTPTLSYIGGLLRF